jgi:hypothetical protein
MPCPYLAEVTMVYCRASPVRKLIPSDRLTTASHCDAGEYGACPLFVEALARAGEAIRDQELEQEPHGSAPASEPHPKGAKS